MVERLPIITDIHFEQSPERLKIVMPLRRHWPYLLIYTILATLWTVMMIGGFIFAIQLVRSGARYTFVFVIMVLIFLFILYRFGRFLFRQWAHYLAGREVLFINLEELILRRPISIWGNTDVYDIQHISGIKESAKPVALTFDYGYRHIYFGEGITAGARTELGRFLNERYFPTQGDEETDEF